MNGPVFYVDDSRDDLFYLQYIWRKAAVPRELLCFQTSEEAYSALVASSANPSTRPAMVIADLYMPLESGLRLINFLSRDEGFADIVLAICSGSDAAEDRARALKSGASIFLGKPIEIDLILHSL